MYEEYYAKDDCNEVGLNNLDEKMFENPYFIELERDNIKLRKQMRKMKKENVELKKKLLITVLKRLEEDRYAQ